MSGELSERALILAPNGRDAFVARDMLEEAGVRGRVVSSIGEFVQALETGAGCAIVTEEALAGTDLHALSDLLDAQLEWSDFPFVLLTLVVPIALLVPRRTRRFGRYMAFGVVATAIVVIGVAVGVLWFLLNRDR